MCVLNNAQKPHAKRQIKGRKKERKKFNGGKSDKLWIEIESER